jgi:hypothetical protein
MPPTLAVPIVIWVVSLGTAGVAGVATVSPVEVLGSGLAVATGAGLAAQPTNNIISTNNKLITLTFPFFNILEPPYLFMIHHLLRT